MDTPRSIDNAPRSVSNEEEDVEFTAEYNAEVVKLVRKSGKTTGQIARELDLTETAVRAWAERATIDEKKESEDSLTTEEIAELARLRRESSTSTLLGSMN